MVFQEPHWWGSDYRGTLTAQAGQAHKAGPLFVPSHRQGNRGSEEDSPQISDIISSSESPGGTRTRYAVWLQGQATLRVTLGRALSLRLPSRILHPQLSFGLGCPCFGVSRDPHAALGTLPVTCAVRSCLWELSGQAQVKTRIMRKMTYGPWKLGVVIPRRPKTRKESAGPVCHLCAKTESTLCCCW